MTYKSVKIWDMVRAKQYFKQNMENSKIKAK